MSKDFIWILSLIFLTAALWTGTEILRSRKLGVEPNKDAAIYQPIDPELDIEFLNKLESER